MKIKFKFKKIKALLAINSTPEIIRCKKVVKSQKAKHVIRLFELSHELFQMQVNSLRENAFRFVFFN